MAQLPSSGGGLSEAQVLALIGSTSQPLDSDLTAIAALSTTAFGRGLLALASAAKAREALELGSAAQQASSAFDAAGAAAAAAAASQPLDSDLTAIAALSTTAFGRELLTQASAAKAREALGLGTAATQASGAFDTAGAAAAAQSASQPLDSDLTAIAALSTTEYGRAFLALANAAAGRTALGLGSAAVEAASAFQPADSDLTAIAALTTTEYGRAFLALANAGAARTALGLGTAATQATGAFDAAGAATAAQAAAIAAVAGIYDRVQYAPGRASTTAASGTKYFCAGGSDNSSLGLGSAPTYVIPIIATDWNVTGLTTKLRTRAIVQTGTLAPVCDVTLGLYPITFSGGNRVLGTVVPGSTVTISAPAKETEPSEASADFGLPTDGSYALGYTVSATPTAALVVHGYLGRHAV